MNFANLETMLADLAQPSWIEVEFNSNFPLLIFLLVAVILAFCIAVFIYRHLRHPRQRLRRILQNPPTADALDTIHSLIKKLHKKYPQLETLIPELDELRFGPQPPPDEQLQNFYNKIRDICG